MSKLMTALAVAAVMTLSAPVALQAQETTRSAGSALDPASSTVATQTAEKKKPAVKAAGNANCPISGHAVGSMQPGSHVVYKGYKVGLCCDGCKDRFMSDADANLKKALNEKKQ